MRRIEHVQMSHQERDVKMNRKIIPPMLIACWLGLFPTFGHAISGSDVRLKISQETSQCKITAIVKALNYAYFYKARDYFGGEGTMVCWPKVGDPIFKDIFVYYNTLQKAEFANESLTFKVESRSIPVFKPEDLWGSYPLIKIDNSQEISDKVYSIKAIAHKDVVAFGVSLIWWNDQEDTSDMLQQEGRLTICSKDSLATCNPELPPRAAELGH